MPVFSLHFCVKGKLLGYSKGVKQCTVSFGSNHPSRKEISFHELLLLINLYPVGVRRLSRRITKEVLCLRMKLSKQVSNFWT